MAVQPCESTFPQETRRVRKLLSGVFSSPGRVTSVALLRLAEEWRPQIARLLELTPQAIRKIAHRTVKEP